MKRSAASPLDVIATLSQALEMSASLVPGPAQLEMGGATVDAPEGTPAIEVDILEERGNHVRVGVRLSNVRFAMWTSRAHLLLELRRDVMIESGAVLRARARVHPLAHEGERTKVRYVGAVAIEGWVPDDALSERGPAYRIRPPSTAGRKQRMLIPGSIIRSEPKWSGKELAVLSHSYFLEEIQQLDGGWFEVAYEDGDVSVRGFVSKQAPPGRTHRMPALEPTTPTPANATVATHTCLYAGGEPIGFLDGEQQVALRPGEGRGWMTLTLDTPLGPIDFTVKGATEKTLETCGT